MDYKNLLKEQFPNDIILEAKLINSNDPILEVVLNTRDLSVVEEYSRKIFTFLETQTWYKDNYSLEVLSRGDDLNLDKNDLGNNLGQMVKITTHKSFEGLNIFIAELLSESDDKILVKWNKKGQFRKIEFNKDNIIKIESYIKF
ncbi:ribosome assembly cofactor RimP [Mycoplasmopsis glycophila]|uniref:Ribosome maturation factor RimP n=1 Tax=Mycoplasmopsis glycophila TaxID=171285 RepID=A0A449AVM2_9BACT|nr:ribosome assembly cofactor RimP [Mycoplasmopsis glycophila]VEU70593.1 Uncharacterised protein [Mycoplasmopsis glycophila]